VWEKKIYLNKDLPQRPEVQPEYHYPTPFLSTDAAHKATLRTSVHRNNFRYAASFKTQHKRFSFMNIVDSGLSPGQYDLLDKTQAVQVHNPEKKSPPFLVDRKKSNAWLREALSKSEPDDDPLPLPYQPAVVGLGAAWSRCRGHVVSSLLLAHTLFVRADPETYPGKYNTLRTTFREVKPYRFKMSFRERNDMVHTFRFHAWLKNRAKFGEAAVGPAFMHGFEDHDVPPLPSSAPGATERGGSVQGGMRRATTA
jgi:hypothetical protein